MKPVIIFFTATIFFISCNLVSGNNPEKVFQAVGLSSNKVNGNFERTFKEMRAQKQAGHLYVYEGNKAVPAKTFEEYVKFTYSTYFDKNMEEVKKLKPTDETSTMIDRSLKMFSRAKEVYNQEFVRIARMLDEGQTDETVDKAIQELSQTRGAELEDMRSGVLDLVLPYAKKHGIEVKTLPSFK